MLDHRLQILLDEGRYQKLTREAQRRNTSIAALIREAIDAMQSGQESRREAIEAILAASPMEVPDDPRQLRQELDRAHDRFDR